MDPENERSVGFRGEPISRGSIELISAYRRESGVIRSDVPVWHESVLTDSLVTDAG